MLTIRPERPSDYAAVATIHIHAFQQRPDEALIVALLRQRMSYTPELALVAEWEGQVVGHALFTPSTMRLMRQSVSIALLAPIGILPSYQGRGIGAALIEAGHSAARQRGCELAVLLGHSSYYPRFGYETHSFGMSSLSLQTQHIPFSPLEARAPLAHDLTKLMDLWQYEEGNVDFALQPEKHLVDWLGLHSSIKAQVYLRNQEVVGYSRSVGQTVRMFLAKDAIVARAMAKILSHETGQVTLPLHPFSASANAFDRYPSADTWAAGMAMPLSAGQRLFSDYLAHLRNAQVPAGRPIWFTAFDLA